ncbi:MULTISPECIES: hypothetical protein [Brevundimonas]|uniref:hypothetical protein n=1 Tax=Brevundimonas TaxID=41275 RepID=UPI0025BB73FB|nr:MULTISPECIES: hypothetical protein [Brevundimonas]
MSRMIETGEVKALFRQLVKAAGGVEAAAVDLKISHQRVSHLQNANNEDEPTFRQIRVLEVAAGAAIVSGAQFRAIEGAAPDPIAAAVVESVASSAAALRLVHDMDADGHRDAAEVRAVQEAAARNLREARELNDAAAGLKPGEVA